MPDPLTPGDTLPIRIEPAPPEDRMMKYFAFEHLPLHLRSVSQPFGEIARQICLGIKPGPERTAGLRKLLEAKDCIVRAKLHPGG